MSNNRKFMEINRKRWEELVDYHVGTSYYDVDSFKQGESSLTDIERELLGDLNGSKILHLQCHFGMDTMSLLYEGAEEVVGVDYSENAIVRARELRDELNLNARFVESNILDLAENFDEYGSFDIVFTSYGTIGWLSDLSPWGKNIYQFLKPGGRFIIVDTHPFSRIFDDEISEAKLILRHDYFNKEATHFEVTGSYADIEQDTEYNDEYLWLHSIDEIISALTDTGMYVSDMKEYNRTNWKQFKFLEQHDDGWYYFPKDITAQFPLLFSLVAIKT